MIEDSTIITKYELSEREKRLRRDEIIKNWEYRFIKEENLMDISGN